MTTDSTGGRTDAAARRFGWALPLAATLLTLYPAPLPAHPGPSATPPSGELPALGELITGSASGSSTMPDSADGLGASDTGDAIGGVAGTAGELMGFESGSVATACAGSAVLGSAALAAGSGGSGSLVPGLLVGGGSSGSGAGSVVVGSAAAGSALLTCLLLLPVPESPGIPLELGPAAVPPVAAPPEPRVPVRTPEPPARTPLEPAIPMVAAPTPRSPAAAPDTGWTALQMMTVLIITLIAAARVRALRIPRA
ncbi:hypothetical protein [Nocardia otitidiscaviarum]|uniref:hypothetical protein n=1 Tax=Nocardia otitidiscaviarum TaxID=1823 RepID=UPI0024579488|nr:hypothetical protein [Nocardia otitidiscaviarum]